MKVQKSIAAFFLAIGIVLGAFGAHGLKPLIDQNDFSTYETGVLYWLIQSVALLATQLKKWPCMLVIGGQLAFSGSLFLLSTRSLHNFGVEWMGPITPVGGMLLIVGWLLAAKDLFIAESEKTKL